MDTVTEEQAKKLHALGYGGQWPQMVYQWEGNGASLVYREGPYVFYSMEERGSIPAPSYSEALDWLEEKKGRLWNRSTPDEMVPSGTYTALVGEYPESSRAWVQAATRSELLDAILEKETADGRP